MIRNKNIDEGKGFDFGRTSENYAKFRDIYPREFYEKIVDKGLCVSGQNVLDIGTGTGVLPRNMYQYGATWTGIDISENQIMQAKKLAATENMNIEFSVCGTEELKFPSQTFDVATACQCFMYFDYERMTPLLKKILKPEGKIVILYMAWLPNEDEIAGASENLVLTYNPTWTGAGETRKPIYIPDRVRDDFAVISQEVYDIEVPFTRESWHGRMKTCRGIGASLPENDIAKWEIEHRDLLNKIAPESFNVLHYAAMTVLKVK